MDCAPSAPSRDRMSVGRGIRRNVPIEPMTAILDAEMDTEEAEGVT